jgi:hypothetical protein
MKRETLTMLTVLVMSTIFGITDLVAKDTINIVTIVMLFASVCYFISLFVEEGLSMFNWFGSREYPKTGQVAPLTTPSTYPDVPKVTLPSENGYTIGVDDCGSTILRLTCDYSSTTLTMNKAGVRQMIRLLEATLVKDSASE